LLGAREGGNGGGGDSGEVPAGSSRPAPRGVARPGGIPAKPADPDLDVEGDEVPF